MQQTTLTGFVLPSTDTPSRKACKKPPPLFTHEIECRYGCGRKYKWASSESRHAKQCEPIVTRRKNMNKFDAMSLEIKRLQAIIDHLHHQVDIGILSTRTS